VAVTWGQWPRINTGNHELWYLQAQSDGSQWYLIDRCRHGSTGDQAYLFSGLGKRMRKRIRREGRVSGGKVQERKKK